MARRLSAAIAEASLLAGDQQVVLGRCQPANLAAYPRRFNTRSSVALVQELVGSASLDDVSSPDIMRRSILNRPMKLDLPAPFVPINL